jgi:holliday junction DNA helicase RuvA
MIGYLKGKVISLKPTKLLLDVNGVGYLINISILTYEKISAALNVSLYIFTNVKEDSITLYGFYTEAEKEMFELLISVNGVGPKIALSILSGIKTEDLVTAINQNNISRIVSVPGIGRKTAERLLLELKNKVTSLSASQPTSGIPDSQTEAILALATLGYNNKTAEPVIRNLVSEDPSLTLENLIKKALSQLNS